MGAAIIALPGPFRRTAEHIRAAAVGTMFTMGDSGMSAFKGLSPPTGSAAANGLS